MSERKIIITIAEDRVCMDCSDDSIRNHEVLGVLKMVESELLRAMDEGIQAKLNVALKRIAELEAEHAEFMEDI